ncbi:hypothetical protein ACFU46_32115 [Streptomyces griseoincarnatus]
MTAKPRRTMLPPRLTRHLYETRRLLAEGEGRQMPPWYRLTPEQRADAEMDMEVFRRAIPQRRGGAGPRRRVQLLDQRAAGDRPAAGELQLPRLLHRCRAPRAP